MKIALTIILLVLLVSCRTMLPKDIPPTQVSSGGLARFDCVTLKSLKSKIDTDYKAFEEEIIDSKHVTDNEYNEFSKLKGQKLALDRRYKNLSCNEVLANNPGKSSPARYTNSGISGSWYVLNETSKGYSCTQVPNAPGYINGLEELESQTSGQRVKYSTTKVGDSVSVSSGGASRMTFYESRKECNEYATKLNSSFLNRIVNYVTGEAGRGN